MQNNPDVRAALIRDLESAANLCCMVHGMQSDLGARLQAHRDAISQPSPASEDRARLSDELMGALRSALRFAGSRSAITSEQERGILSAFAGDNSYTDTHPEWQDGGNSFAQDEARRAAHAILTPPAPEETVRLREALEKGAEKLRKLDRKQRCMGWDKLATTLDLARQALSTTEAGK